jgi:hypothetical protein
MTSERKSEPVQVIVCTEDDMRASSFGPLQQDPRAPHEPTAEERELLGAMFQAFRKLERLGWRESMYAPRDHSTFLAIEAGSTGIHECQCDRDGKFWAYYGDVWPSHPILWKPLDLDTAREREELLRLRAQLEAEAQGEAQAWVNAAEAFDEGNGK